MKHLIIYAHPYSESFCSSLRNRIIQSSKNLGIETVERNLYDIDFQPVLQPDEIVNLQKGELQIDVLEEQRLIQNSEAITFIYPIWWTQMPAILKGYLDRVFSNGFAYKPVGHHEFEGLLKNKYVAIYNTIGTTMKESIDQGLIDAMKTLLHKGVIEYVGMDVALHRFINPFEIEDGNFDSFLDEIEQVTKTFLLECQAKCSKV